MLFVPFFFLLCAAAVGAVRMTTSVPHAPAASTHALASRGVQWISSDDEGDMKRYLLNDTESSGARCLDGSPAGFFYRPATGDSKRLILSLEGGGLCTTPIACWARTLGPEGSSKHYKSTLQSSGIFSGDPLVNPDFADDHLAFVPYCSGDLWSGTRKEATNATFGLYFGGHHTVTEVVHRLLKEDMVLRNGATDIEVVLTGISAGGIGTITHANWIQSTLDDILGQGNARAVAVPDSGWYLNAKPYRYLPDGFVCTELAVPAAWFQAWHDPECSAANTDDPSVCYCGRWMFRHVRVPIFIAETQFDRQQIYTEDGVPEHDGSEAVREYIEYFGDFMRNELYVVGNSTTSGLFSPSCLLHGVQYNFIYAEGQNYQETLACWYFNRDNCKPRVMDYCGQLPCGDLNEWCAHVPL